MPGTFTTPWAALLSFLGLGRWPLSGHLGHRFDPLRHFSEQKKRLDAPGSTGLRIALLHSLFAQP